MKQTVLLILLSAILLYSCSKTDQNPFFTEWKTPFQTPPFEKIKEQHYIPAFKEGMMLHQQEIEAIVNKPEPTTFENTVVVTVGERMDIFNAPSMMQQFNELLDQGFTHFIVNLSKVRVTDSDGDYPLLHLLKREIIKHLEKNQ